MESKRTPPIGQLLAIVVAVLLVAGAIAFAARNAESGEHVQRTSSGSLQPGSKAKDTDKGRGQGQQNDGDNDDGG